MSGSFAGDQSKILNQHTFFGGDDILATDLALDPS